MSDRDKRITVSVEDLIRSNSLQLKVLAELHEELGTITQDEVLERMRATRETKTPY